MQYLIFTMDFSFYKEYFILILILLTIPVYWLINFILKKSHMKSGKLRAFVAFIVTMFIIIVIGFIIVLRGFILYHNIPGV